jgi:predicted RNA-binding protein YlxR (DUF448 family)
VAGKIQLDKTGTLPGRGAYLLKKDEVLLALTKHAFNRAFHKDVTPEEEEAIKKAYESIK